MAEHKYNNNTHISHPLVPPRTADLIRHRPIALGPFSGHLPPVWAAHHGPNASLSAQGALNLSKSLVASVDNEVYTLLSDQHRTRNTTLRDVIAATDALEAIVANLGRPAPRTYVGPLSTQGERKRRSPRRKVAKRPRLASLEEEEEPVADSDKSLSVDATTLASPYEHSLSDEMDTPKLAEEPLIDLRKRQWSLKIHLRRKAKNTSQLDEPVFDLLGSLEEDVAASPSSTVFDAHYPPLHPKVLKRGFFARVQSKISTTLTRLKAPLSTYSRKQ